MRVRSFVPGHVSCIFQPIPSDDCLKAGSRGVGIRLSLGSVAEVGFRDDKEVRITIDGSEREAEVTRLVATTMAPGRGLDIDIKNDLPMGQGFATSASGAMATAMCLGVLTDVSPRTACESAHSAEVRMKGGLGDVSAIVSGQDVPIRMRPGMPPHGEIQGAPFSVPDLTLAVIGDTLSTASILSDRVLSQRISDAGGRYTDMFMEDPTPDNLFEYSYRFAEETGLVPPEMKTILDRLRAEGYGAGMCMLGCSIFTDAPADVVREAAGDGARVFPCSSSHAAVGVTRKE